MLWLVASLITEQATRHKIRELKTQIREVIDIDHKFDSSGQSAQMGCHTNIHLTEAADIGTGVTGYPILGAQTDTAPELTYTDESDLKVAALNKMTVRELKENLQIISNLRVDYWLNFNRALSDLMVCLNENDLPLNVLGIRLNRGVEGFFGMTSSLIYLYSLLKFK